MRSNGYLRVARSERSRAIRVQNPSGPACGGVQRYLHRLSADSQTRGKNGESCKNMEWTDPTCSLSESFAPRKNVSRIIQAYDLYQRETKSNAQLVLVGRKWIAGDVDRTVHRLSLEKKVRFIDHMDHARLPDLYCGAEMLVFPSLWESFGIPIIESMVSGTPVLTSRGSCLPEIAGDAAVLVDPYSVEAIAEGICRIMGDPMLAAELQRQPGLHPDDDFRRWRRHVPFRDV